MQRRWCIRKPWGVALVFVGLALIGILWWLSFHDWSFEEMAAARELARSQKDADTLDFSGTYRIQGPGYIGKLTVRPAGEGYNLCCRLSDSTVYYGNGIKSGKVLAAIYSLRGGKYGMLAVYEKQGEELSGLVARINSDKVRTEFGREAKKLSASSHRLAGVYRITGKHPNKKAYQGSMELERTGSTYTAYWRMADGSSYSGTCLAYEDVAVMGYVSATGVGLGAYEIKGRDLEGRWFYTDHRLLSVTSDIRTGTERLKPASRSSGIGENVGGE